MIRALLLCLLLAGGAVADEMRRVEGPWFAAEVPAGFAVEVLAEARAAEGPMTVRMTAPDGAAAFLIHAPLWAAPTPAVEGRAGEVLVARRVAEAAGARTTWVTWRSEATGAQRSYRIVEERGGALTVYGFEYADAAALARWRPAYAAFLDSVERFAD